MLQKTFWIFSRNYKNVCTTLLCPIVWCTLIVYFNSQEGVIRDVELKEGRIH